MTCERLLFSGALLVMLRVPAGAQDKPPSPEALAAAEAAVVAARSEKDLAAAGLEALVYDLADDYAALTSDADAPARRQALVLAMHDALPPPRASPPSWPRAGPSCAARRQILQEAFTEPVAAARRWIALRLLPAAPRVRRWRAWPSTITSEQIPQAIDATLPAGHNWYEFWNQVFRGLRGRATQVALTALGGRREAGPPAASRALAPGGPRRRA
jgi:hypothetical protein